MLSRFIVPPEGSFFLFGPRGAGKSTWLKQHYSKAFWIDLLDPATVRRYSARPERLEEVVYGSDRKVIIIDEIQKIPELLSVVHRLIEQKQGWQFILTGSSARKLKRDGVNLLAGRALVKHLHPFMAAELGQQFNLKRALQFGLVPLVVMSSDPKSVLDAYVELYLREEVKAESLVRNIGDFSRFLEIVSFSHGSILNISNIARECGVSRKLIENYLSILHDLLLSFSLPVFTRRAKRQTVLHPKFYFFDSGIFDNLRAQGPLDKDTEIDGSALEGLVAQHLRAWIDYSGDSYSLYYWRTRHGVEVDFIVYGTNGFWAVEVKNKEQIFTKDLSGLLSFCQDYPLATPLLLYRGTERLKIKNVLCLPVTEFLLQLNPEKEGLV